MADEQATTTNTPEQTEQSVNVTPTLRNPFDEESWKVTPITETPEIKQEVKEEPKPTPVEAQPTTPSTDNPLKIHLGYETWEDAKAEIETLKKVKPSELKFANEESEKIFSALKEGKESDILEYLQKKNEFTKAESLNIEDANTAKDFLKTAYKYIYKDLTASEIQDMIDESYVKPEKPIKDELTDDDAYSEQVERWKRQCEAIDKKMIRDAKLARPELLKHKTEIQLPDIPKNEAPTQVQPTQEELEADRKFRESFLQSAESTVKDFKGFSVQVKDKDVDYQVSYGLSDSQRQTLNERMKYFTENYLNANSLLAQRWVNEDKSLNTQKMTEDLSLILFKDEILQKVANESANQRMEIYLKEKKNINLNGATTSGTFQPQGTKTETEKLAEFFFDN